MDIGSIFLVLALLVLVIFFVSQPFVDRRRIPATAVSTSTDHELSSLLAERDRTLNALQELDFDHTLGKIPEEDYPAQRQRLLQYGADVLRKLDELQGELTAHPASGQSATSAEVRIEAAVAARRADAARTGASPQQAVNGGKVVPASVAAPDDEMEVMLANRRRAQQSDAVGFCTKCGAALQRSDKFCPKCGVRVN
jgi:hypothetical protein